MSDISFDESRVRRPTLHHVNLKTLKLQELIDWYEKVIGSKVNFQWPGGAFVTNDEANHRIALISLPDFVDDPDKLTRTGMHHSAFEYEHIDDLLATFLRLKAEGILPGACLDHGLTLSFYYHDPDGNSVELQADNYGDWAASTEFIRTDPRFGENPIGSPVDPDAYLAARAGGMDVKELHERAYAGEYPPSGPFDIRLPLP
ncbi:Biphenyl-2,3-diol 1,2-dioxygenase 2 [Paraconexibacter sp. AEG42_29]|uniref:Biphenyl-2,3-diol 1,2-dioxygenase 2 n=1 Tax=Paraconexibacter sp. AEG42_29 TaxID=2997339 RepID=A0AAU7AYQ6_9ACTN